MPFSKYFAPNDIDSACQLLKQYADDYCQIFAGGQKLMPLIRRRLSTFPRYVVDISRITNLSFVKEDEVSLRVGALTTLSDLETSQVIYSKYPVMTDAIKCTGDPQIRNRATVGGLVAFHDPADAFCAAVLAGDASVELVKAGGKGRNIESKEFFKDVREKKRTSLEPDEVISSITIPKKTRRTGSAYLNLTRRHLGEPIVGVAGVIASEENSKDKVSEAAIAISCTAKGVERADKAEDYLEGKSIDSSVILEASKKASDDVEMESDMQGSQEYKSAMVEVLVRRTISQALSRVPLSSLRQGGEQ